MESLLTTDIYDITSNVKELQERYISEEDPETLAIGIFGYLADIHSLILQNSTITAGEMGNELFPQRAKFERNVINHAIYQCIEDINAIPAEISAIIGLFEEDIYNYSVSDKFILDKDIVLGVDDYEFHLPYDVIIKKTVLPNNEVGYSAQYDMSRKNPLSDIVNPYLVAPFRQKYGNKNIIFFYVTLMQVSHSTISKTTLTNNAVENKTVVFEFEDQLADFLVKVTEGNKVRYLTPVFEGMGLEQNLKEDFCYYSYADESHIKIRFDSLSYVPKINAKIEIQVKTTKGASGNFEYNTSKELYPILESSRFSYKKIMAILRFASNSIGGLDRKSVAELRKILPKEILSRGSITCWQDLENYFNMMNTDLNRLIIQKRVDNQFERSYFAYMLMKDNFGNVVPTNTFDIDIADSDFDMHDNRKYILKPGVFIQYKDINTNNAVIVKRTEENSAELDALEAEDRVNFIYTCPFMMVVTADPLHVSYYLNLINTMVQTDFTYVNENALVQYICTNVKWYREYNNNPNSYFMEFAFSQNLDTGYNLIEVDDNNVIQVNKLKVFAVFFNDGKENVPYAYAECKYNTDYKEGKYTYAYKLELKTEDNLSDDNRIYITGLKRAGSTDEAKMLLTPHVGVKIYICTNFNDDYGVFGRYDIDPIVPDLDDYTVCNMYTLNGGLKFYENYSEIISSQVTDIFIEDIYTTHTGFHVMRVPCIRRSYATIESNLANFVDNINFKKAYIDNALYILEDNFLIDFKFFNTYGPSRTYTLDRAGTKLIDRVNLTLDFELKLLQNSDKNTKDYILKDIKDTIEDLNDISSLHIPNLITDITTKYRESIEYLEFKGFNGYGPGIQHIYRQDFNVLTGTKDINMVPEFLTVHTDLDMTPDINITLV